MSSAMFQHFYHHIRSGSAVIYSYIPFDPFIYAFILQIWVCALCFIAVYTAFDADVCKVWVNWNVLRFNLSYITHATPFAKR